MIAPLSMAYWKALRRLVEPFKLMEFTLIYDGDLPASGNSPKPTYASTIRNEFHDQLADLWDSHVILRQLARTGRTIPNPGAGYYVGQEPIWSPSKLPDYRDPIPPLITGQIDFCAPIPVSNVGSFIPLVRNSLYLACGLDILFLRHEEPLNLMKQGGDLDGRLKTLFDALRMPTDASQQARIPLTADPLYVLLEDNFSFRSSDQDRKTARPTHQEEACRSFDNRRDNQGFADFSRERMLARGLDVTFLNARSAASSVSSASAYKPGDDAGI